MNFRSLGQHVFFSHDSKLLTANRRRALQGRNKNLQKPGKLFWQRDKIHATSACRKSEGLINTMHKDILKSLLSNSHLLVFAKTCIKASKWNIFRSLWSHLPQTSRFDEKNIQLNGVTANKRNVIKLSFLAIC